MFCKVNFVKELVKLTIINHNYQHAKSSTTYLSVSYIQHSDIYTIIDNWPLRKVTKSSLSGQTGLKYRNKKQRDLPVRLKCVLIGPSRF